MAQRVWPMPIVPWGSSVWTRFSRFFSLPVARTTFSDVAVHHRHARGVIPPVLELLQPGHQDGSRLLVPDVPNNAAHVVRPLSRPSPRWQIPGAPHLHRATPVALTTSKSRAHYPSELLSDLEGPASEDLAMRAFFLSTQPSLLTCGVRDTARLPGGTSFVTVVPAPTYAPSPTFTGATSWRVGADEDAVTQLGEVLVHPVVVAGDGAGADVHPGADLRVARGRRGGWPWSRGRCRAFFVSTKLPRCTSSASSVPGRNRAKGPMMQRSPTRASSSTE